MRLTSRSLAVPNTFAISLLIKPVFLYDKPQLTKPEGAVTFAQRLGSVLANPVPEVNSACEPV
jgi:hypothetical protein